MIENARVSEGWDAQMHAPPGAITLELTGDEAELLARMLPVGLTELRGEIIRTDSFAYRQALKKDEEILKRLTKYIAAVTRI